MVCYYGHLLDYFIEDVCLWLAERPNSASRNQRVEGCLALADCVCKHVHLEPLKRVDVLLFLLIEEEIVFHHLFLYRESGVLLVHRNLLEVDLLKSL